MVDCSSIALSGFNVSLCGRGRGQGMATYYRSNFTLVGCLEENHLNIMKVTNGKLDIIGVYCSPKDNPGKLIEHLKTLVDNTMPTVVLGDFNICLLKNKNNPVTKFLESAGFTQLVEEATHIEV